MILALLVLGTTLVLAEEKLYDDALAKRAVVVLRVELQHARHEFLPDKYPFIRYTVLGRRVFKNESYTKDGNLLQHFFIRGFDNKAGVPPGESTVYLQRYHVDTRQFGGKEGTIWMLVDGGGTNAVSHVGGKTNLQ
jgi:hypothetical protein